MAKSRVQHFACRSRFARSSQGPVVYEQAESVTIMMAKQFTVKPLSLPYPGDQALTTTSVPLLMPENAVYNPEEHTMYLRG